MTPLGCCGVMATNSKHRAPGRSDRQGLSLAELFRRFPDDAAAEAWFIDRRWPDGCAVRIVTVTMRRTVRGIRRSVFGVMAAVAGSAPALARRWPTAMLGSASGWSRNC